MGREKTRGADVEIHLTAVTIHDRAFARPVGCVVGPSSGCVGVSILISSVRMNSSLKNLYDSRYR